MTELGNSGSKKHFCEKRLSTDNVKGKTIQEGDVSMRAPRGGYIKKIGWKRQDVG